MNDYLAILVGLLLTIVVQSSSVTTSALTPLVGIGVLPVYKMLPMTLGANVLPKCEFDFFSFLAFCDVFVDAYKRIKKNT